MNFKKKKNSKNKVFNILGLILLPIIVVIILESSINFVEMCISYCPNLYRNLDKTIFLLDLILET